MNLKSEGDYNYKENLHGIPIRITLTYANFP